MLINWFTVLAQIVNFLILVYLLKRFLYGPIIRAMQEREKKIARRLQDAEDGNWKPISVLQPSKMKREASE